VVDVGTPGFLAEFRASISQLAAKAVDEIGGDTETDERHIYVGACGLYALERALTPTSG